LAGVLLPSATVFLVLLCNDKAVLGPWVNKPWLNVVAVAIVSVLLVLSLILMTTTVFPHIDVGTVLVVLGVVLVVTLSVAGVLYARALSRRHVPEGPAPKRETWRMHWSDRPGPGAGEGRCFCCAVTWCCRSSCCSSRLCNSAPTERPAVVQEEASRYLRSYGPFLSA
jgi:hypothetical protein